MKVQSKCAGLMVVAGLISVNASAGQDPVSARARAEIFGCTDPTISGVARLSERRSANGIKRVDVKLRVDGLPPGRHAVHIHEVANCPPCADAGGHFDPGPNGNSSPDGNHPFHLGDLINVVVNPEGRGRMNSTTTRFTLSPGPLSLFDSDGSAFMIHANPDTFCPDGVGPDGLPVSPGCSGGERVACGVIEPDPPRECGDGVETPPEQCDDGNTANGDGCSATCRVEQSNRAPTAAAGPDQPNAVTGQAVTLNGSASNDPDNKPNPQLTFSWAFAQVPSGSNATITGATTARPSFTPNVIGTYRVTLTVSDGDLSAQDEVVITATAPNVPNMPPRADAGPNQSAEVLTLVTLNGSASNDPDNKPNPQLTFSWAFAEVPSGSSATITDATTARPSFTPNVIGTYRVTLTVSDGDLSGQDEVVITATAPNVPNMPPIANAGPDQPNAVMGQAVTLNGSASDPDIGDTLAFSWRFVNRPSRSVAVIVNPASLDPSFTPDVGGTYELELRVTDGTLSDTDSVVITVAHLVRLGNFFFSPNRLPIQAGDTVQFINGDGNHDVRVGTNTLLGPPVGTDTNTKWEFKRPFNESVSIFCFIHGAAVMSGQIMVNP